MLRSPLIALLAAVTVLASCAGGGTLGTGNDQAALPDAAAPPPERDVDRLIGVSRERLLDTLGPSAFTRRDGPAEIWRYATDDCFLTLFLHRGDQPRGGGLTVQHIEAHARTRAAGAWVNKRNCYGQLLELRGITPAVS